MSNSIPPQPRKSEYGKNLTFFLEPEPPFLGCNQVLMGERESSFVLSPIQEQEIEEAWNKKSGGKRPLREGTWRYEGYSLDSDKNLHLWVSPSKYVWHNILRETKEMPQSFYPTPITVNSIQLTTDGFIPIAVRGGISDQRGLAFLGSGFFDNENNLPPKNPFSVAESECREEGAYDLPCPESAFYIGDAKFLGLSVGSNTDMTAYIYIPLRVPHTKLRLNRGSKEHSDLWFLPTDADPLYKFLKEGGMRGGIAADHCIGGIEQYLLNKEKLSR